MPSLLAAPARPAARKSSETKTAAAKTTPKPGAQEHIVKKGETLWSISQKYSTSVGEVMELNKMSKEAVRDGMKLKIPPREAAVDPRKARRKVHVVDDEETFWSIANQYNITAEALANANPSVNPNRLHPDMELNIPPVDPNQPAKPATPPKPPVTLKPSETIAGTTKPAGEKEASSSKPEPASTSSAPISGAEHTIAEGETFYALARKYGVSMEAIVAANPSVNPRRMKNGSKVIIPEKSAVTKAPKPAEEGAPAPASLAKTTPPTPVVTKPVKPLAPLPGPNALPIPKPKVTALTSEPIKKTITSPVVEKEKEKEKAKAEKPDHPDHVRSGSTSPVVLTAPSAPPTPRVVVNPTPAPKPDEAPAAPPKSGDANSSKAPANTVGSDGVIRSYIVSDGESESTISEAFGISKEQLYEYNRLPATARLKPGDEIMIPRVAKIGQ
ncbi:MAG: LysM peptidoglycan-binding domain-containing protein [Verrucomicrobium sp.]